MSPQAFLTLMAEFFRVTGAADVQTLAGAGHCRCFGLDMSFYYDDRIDPTSIHAYLDMGTVTPARQREVFSLLLRRNPRYQRTHSAVLGLDADTDRIVLVARIAADDALTGRRLADILAQLIRRVYVMRAPKPSVRFGTGKARTLRWAS